jgi:hypothetical protein
MTLASWRVVGRGPMTFSVLCFRWAPPLVHTTPVHRPTGQA